MPIVNRIADFHDEITAWRQDIHAHPELLFDVHRTAGVVAEKLKSFGCDEVVTGIGRTGVVGVIRGKKGGGTRTIGLRADMDALPIEEATGLSYKSQNAGKMHACGHDGHTAMLLGAAKYLAETRNFDGTAVVIFQPAEEGGGGGREMVNDGMMDRFRIEEVYGMHNYPGFPIGDFAIRSGPMMAAADRIYIDIEGLGGHAARPHTSIDTVVVGAAIINALQSIVSRNVDPLESAVVSITQFHAGTADNIIPQTGAPARHGAKPDAGDARHGREARPRGGGGHREALRRQGHADLQARLSGDREPRAADLVCRRGGVAGGRQGARRHHGAAGDGRGGFLLHAGGAARRLHLRRQRRQRGAASPGLQLQRRGDPGRHVVLGEARRDRARAADALDAYCAGSDLLVGGGPAADAPASLSATATPRPDGACQHLAEPRLRGRARTRSR